MHLSTPDFIRRLLHQPVPRSTEELSQQASTPEMKAMIEAALEAGRIAMEGLHADDHNAEQKGLGRLTDVVTVYDAKAQHKIQEMLTSAFPQHGFFGEESKGATLESPSHYTFVVDPIDGTRNFMAHSPDFATGISLYYHPPGQTAEVVASLVYQPATGALYCADLRDGKGLQFNHEAKKLFDATMQNHNGKPQLFHEAAKAHNLEQHISPERVKHYYTIIDQAQARGWNIEQTGSSALGFAHAAMAMAHGKEAAMVVPVYWAWDYAQGMPLMKAAGQKRGNYYGVAQPFDAGSDVPTNINLTTQDRLVMETRKSGDASAELPVIAGSARTVAQVLTMQLQNMALSERPAASLSQAVTAGRA